MNQDDSLSALSTLAAALRAQRPPVDPDTAATRLARPFLAAASALCAQLRAADRRLGPEDAEDVVQTLAGRLGGLYGAWRQEGSFGAFLWTTARNLARQTQRGLDRTEAMDGEPVDAADEHRSDGAEAVGLRRYIWYRFGSPDNPDRWIHAPGRGQRLAPASLMALQARLHGQSAAWLVTNLQPRPDTAYWGPDRGEEDRKWWRNRATLAYRQIQDELAGSPAERAHLANLVRALRDGPP